MHVYICFSLIWFLSTPSPGLQVEYEPVDRLASSAGVKFEPLRAQHGAIRALRTSLLMYSYVCMYACISTFQHFKDADNSAVA